MRSALFLFFSVIVATMLTLVHAGSAWANNVVTLATGERVPYIGKALPENGYVAEVATEAFRRRGYRLKIEFYPWARARMLADKGEVDGILPIFRPHEASQRTLFIYSHPFPGDTIGFLKKKSLPFSYSAEDLRKKDRLINALKPYHIGMVRGGISIPYIEDEPSLVKELTSEDIHNLDKLDLDRIQFALIDKYTAADLMVGQRPHLIGRFEFLMPPLAERDFYIGFSNMNTRHRQLVTAFNEGLAELKKDGTLSTILKKHGLYPKKKEQNKKVHLTIGTVNNSDMKVMQNLSKEFEKQHPNIELEWRTLDENTLRLRLLSDLAISDGQFDVMTIGTYETPLWAKQGWIKPLSLSPDYAAQDLLPSVRASLSYQDKLFALPFYAESSMTFYRKDLFAKAGITMPPNPSYEDIQKFASRIHDPAAGIYGICLRGKPGWGENMAFLGTLVNTYGGRWFDATWKPELNSSAWENAMTFYVGLLTRYGPPNPDRNGFNENLKLFSEGHCGIWIDATVAAGILFDPTRSTVASHLGYVAAPIALTKKGSAWLWSWALTIPNASQHKSEAMEFISWATSKQYIQKVAQKYGWIAVPPGTRKSTYENKNYLQAAPFAQFVLSAINNTDLKDSTLQPKPYLGIQYVDIPEFPAIGNQVGIEIANALRGEQSAKDALAKSQEKVYMQMKNSGYIKERTENRPAQPH